MSRSRVLLSAAIILAAAGCSPESATTPLARTGNAPASLQNADPVLHGTIAFHGFRDGAFDIFVMNADGTGQTRFALSDANDFDPVWSPNGQRIAFVSYGTTFPFGAIRVMNATGTGLQVLFEGSDGRFVGNVAWSPDGQRLAFAFGGDVHVMNADGTGLTRVTTDASVQGVTAWSPNGRQISFIGGGDGDAEIYFVDADGQNVVQVTHNGVSDEGDHAAWSQDGRRFLFSSRRDGGDLDIFVLNLDGGDVTQLTFNDVDDDDPFWSPNGKHIAFHSVRGGDEEIYVVNADGSGLRQLTDDAGFAWQAFNAVPAWRAR